MRPEKATSDFSAPQRTGVAGFLTDLQEHVSATYCALTSREAVRARLHRNRRDQQIDKARSPETAHASALGQLYAQIARIHRAGAHLSELLVVPHAMMAFVQALAGEAPRSLDKLDLDEERVSAKEDVAQMERRVQMLRGALCVEALEVERAFRLERAGLDLEFVHAIDAKLAELQRAPRRIAAGVA